MKNNLKNCVECCKNLKPNDLIYLRSGHIMTVIANTYCGDQPIENARIHYEMHSRIGGHNFGIGSFPIDYPPHIDKIIKSP